jgi:hypothetical protein
MTRDSDLQCVAQGGHVMAPALLEVQGQPGRAKELVIALLKLKGIFWRCRHGPCSEMIASNQILWDGRLKIIRSTE